MLKKYAQSFNVLQRLIDALVIAAAWAIAYIIRFEYMPDAQQGLEWLFTKIGLFLVGISLYSFQKFGLYRSQRFNSRLNEVLTVLRSNLYSFLGLIFLLYFLAPDRLSRIHLVIYFTLSTLLLTSMRLAIRNFLRILRKKGLNLRHVTLIGNAKHLKDYVKAIRNFKDCGIILTGWYDSDGMAEELGVPNAGPLENAPRWKEDDVDAIVIGYKASDSEKLENFLKRNYNNLVPIKIIPDLSYSYVGHQIEDFAGIPLLNVNQPNLSSLELVLKRIFDFVLTLIGLILISPLLLLIAIAVKLSSPGPIFYGQERMGLDGQIFTMWKFRSMRVAKEGEDTKEWSNKDNPRKTKIGDFLRKTSLDELPQLWNVLKGDMSLVGPRPERPYFINQFREEIPGYMLRHKMRAGITGWAQVNGWRGDTSLDKRIECDIYYIKNWSLWLDIKILFMTFFKGFVHKNAY